MRRTGARADRGVSLVEVLISMAILGIATSGIVQMQLVVGQTTYLGRERTQAIQLASQVSEAIQSWDWKDPRLQPATITTGAPATEIVIDGAGDAISATKTPQWQLGAYTGAGSQATNANGRNLASGSPDPLLPAGPWDWVDTSTAACASPSTCLFRIYWTVTGEDQNSDGIEDARLVSITIRWKEGRGRLRWHDYNTVQARFNPKSLIPNYN